jgi:hypothetical protein
MLSAKFNERSVANETVIQGNVYRQIKMRVESDKPGIAVMTALAKFKRR